MCRYLFIDKECCEECIAKYTPKDRDRTKISRIEAQKIQSKHSTTFKGYIDNKEEE